MPWRSFAGAWRSAQSRDDAALYRAIRRRRTNRQPFLDAPMPEADRRVLTYAAAAEGADLHTIVTPAERFELRCLVAAADRRQREDVVCRAELEAWTRSSAWAPGRGATGYGRPETRTAGPGGCIRQMSNGFGRVRPPDGDFEAEPFVVVLSTRMDGPGCQVQAGQARQRVLLTATALGLTASFLSQPVEVGEERRDCAGCWPMTGTRRRCCGWVSGRRWRPPRGGTRRTCCCRSRSVPPAEPETVSVDYFSK